ncbi:hypothetical protein SDJN02_21671, partial [Cucurbita argyrosperma subsp. argyrosperma]
MPDWRKGEIVGPSRWTIEGRLLPTYVTSHKASSSNATTIITQSIAHALSHTRSPFSPLEALAPASPCTRQWENLPDSLSPSLYFPILEFSNKLVLGDNFFRLLYWLHLRTPALNNPSSDHRPPPPASGRFRWVGLH